MRMRKQANRAEVGAGRRLWEPRWGDGVLSKVQSKDRAGGSRKQALCLGAPLPHQTNQALRGEMAECDTKNRNLYSLS